MVAALSGQGRYADVVPVPLVSDGGTDLATKARIRAVLEALAGRPADLSDVPNTDRIHPATPDDLVLISFSGHGFDASGEFYLVPSDTGIGLDRSISPELTAHAISSSELADWVRDVDGGELPAFFGPLLA